MTDKQQIEMLRTALQEAYTHITQPKKSSRLPNGMSENIYCHPPGEYNRLTSKIRTAMMATQ